MNQSFDNCQGVMPIRVLKNNIIDRLENFRPGILELFKKDVINDCKVNPCIKYIISEETLTPPRANHEKMQIEIREVYLSLVWSVIYYLYFLYQTIEFRKGEGKWKGEINFDSPVLYNARKLFEWAKSLKELYSDWDIKLPNPESPPSEFEKCIGEKTNDIFAYAITFILLHEYAHLANNHYEFLQSLKNQSDLSHEERYALKKKQIENEADNFARDEMLKEYDDDLFKFKLGMGILMACICNLFIIKKPDFLAQKTHPDLDERIFRLLSVIEFEDERWKVILIRMTNLALSNFFINHNIQTSMEEAETDYDLLNQHIETFDSLK